MGHFQEKPTLVLGGAALGSRAAPVTASSLPPDALKIGSRLLEFEITGLIGEGGFGVVYRAFDHALRREVALKEYLPAALAVRRDDAVSVRSAQHDATFQCGLRSFINEARLLAQFDHPALVKVHRVWEANGTAYMVMPLCAGQTLKVTRVEMTQPPDEDWIRGLLDPLLDALEVIHRAGCLHRDIAPDNIMLPAPGRPVLLDFGAARRVIAEMTQALTVILKPGYAPIEQYAELPSARQGAWTDLYALGAVLHCLITGRAPPPAVSRVIEDSCPTLATVAAGRYSQALLCGIDRCLAVKSADRPQSVAELRALIAQPPASAPATVPSPGATHAHQPERQRRHAGTAAVALATLAAGLATTQIPSATEADASTRAAAPIPARVPPTLDAAITATLAGSDPSFRLELAQIRTPLVIGRDPLSFALRSARDGWLHLLLWDRASGQVSLIFPNDSDPDHALAAGQWLNFPRAAWHYEADEPAGDWELLALVSESPRDFSALGFVKQAGVLLASQSSMEQALDRAGGLTLAGQVSCRAGAPACASGYAAIRFTVQETNAAPPAARR